MEQSGLPAKQFVGNRLGDIGEAHVLRQSHQRQAQHLGLIHHRLGHLAQILPGLDAEAGHPAGGQGRDKLGQGGGIVMNGVAGGDHQLSGTEPLVVFRRVAQVDAGHDPLQPGLTAQQAAAPENRQREQFGKAGVIRKRNTAAFH